MIYRAKSWRAGDIAGSRRSTRRRLLLKVRWIPLFEDAMQVSYQEAISGGFIIPLAKGEDKTDTASPTGNGDTVMASALSISSLLVVIGDNCLAI